MKKIILALVVCLAVTACSGNAKTAADKSAQDAPGPVKSLLTEKDMNACEQQLGVAPPKAATDVYVMSSDSIDRIRDCALTLEKQRMPLLADLIDKYNLMLQQGNKECAKDIGTHYGEACMKSSRSDAADWYNLAVSQRLLSEMPNQAPQLQSGKQKQN
jgi:hypothetical protein